MTQRSSRALALPKGYFYEPEFRSRLDVTGRRVSLKTQQRLVHRQTFDPIESDATISEMSLDGGMIRLRTPKGEASEWRDYKALNLAEPEQGMAWFKDNDSLIACANHLELAPTVDRLGDGHDDVWSLYHQVGTPRSLFSRQRMM